MIEAMGSVIKGLYPWFAWLALLGCVVRARTHVWNRMDSVLAIAFGGFIVTILLQSLLFYGIFYVSRRYLLIAVPLYFPWVAWGCLFLKERLSRYCATGKIFPFLLAGIIIFLLYDTVSPLIRERSSSGKSRERLVCLTLSEFIRNDWQRAKFLERLWLKCDQYQNGKRPLVQSDFDKLGYLCGGQNYMPEFSSAGLTPDYIISFSKQPPGNNFKLKEKVFFRQEIIYIYKQDSIYENQHEKQPENKWL